MPEPKIDYYPHNQFSVQQFLHTLCKQHVGSLGKKNGVWELDQDAPASARLSARQDLVEILDYAEQLGIIVPAPPGGASADQADGAFTPYKLSEAYWERFDKFQL